MARQLGILFVLYSLLLDLAFRVESAYESYAMGTVDGGIRIPGLGSAFRFLLKKVLPCTCGDCTREHNESQFDRVAERWAEGGYR